MAIVHPESMDFSKQTFSAIIYGSPGVGKTTLALSAPSPVLIDFDRGVSRVKARHRKATIMCDTYEEVLSDVKSPEMKDFETIVIDTGGAFITYLKDWALRTQPGCRQKNGDFNSLKGFGAVKAEFSSFTDYIKTVLNKNVIYKGTDIPLGRLADAELRKAKMAAHAAFDVIWRRRHTTRKQAYTWLSQQMGLTVEKTHIGMFDVEQCERVISLCKKRMEDSHVQEALSPQ